MSLRDQYGVGAEIAGEGARFTGLRLAAGDLGVVERALSGGGIAATRHVGRVVVPDLCGATLIFEQA